MSKERKIRILELDKSKVKVYSVTDPNRGLPQTVPRLTKLAKLSSSYDTVTLVPLIQATHLTASPGSIAIPWLIAISV